jgi:hypothetical protein
LKQLQRDVRCQLTVVIVVGAFLIQKVLVGIGDDYQNLDE